MHLGIKTNGVTGYLTLKSNQKLYSSSKLWAIFLALIPRDQTALKQKGQFYTADPCVGSLDIKHLM